MALIDNDLLCNFKKCRKRLVTYAWVTSCSHVFCEEDGSREFAKELLCPSCNTELAGKFDIVRVDLQPSDQYKSMMLAGLKPEIIMEIASRGINFWMYQASQERVFYEYAQKKVKESASKVEHYYEQLLLKTQMELKAIKQEMSSKGKELMELRKKLSDISEQHQDKCRQHQKLQLMYDVLRRKIIDPSLSDERPTKMTAEKEHLTYQIGQLIGGSLRNIPSFLHGQNQQRSVDDMEIQGRTSHPPRNASFNLQPFPTPSQVEQQQGDNQYFGSRFTLSLDTLKP